MRRTRLILCGDVSRSPPESADVLALRLSGRRRNVQLRFEGIRQKLTGNIPEEFADLLEIATYVYCADQATTRGGNGVNNYGAKWRRRFHFVVPVRRPDMWSSDEVSAALSEVLGFLSDDCYRFEFERQRETASVQRYFGSDLFNPEPADFGKVVLFSGGLDSLAGAIEEAVGRQHNVVLVTHDSSTKMVRRVRDLVTSLRVCASQSRLVHVPVHIGKDATLSREYTQRSRSFLYVALAAVVGRLFGIRCISFYENGVVSFNLPICAQVLGGRTTRTTHPQVLNGFAKLLKAVSEDDFTVENPFLWKTKADVLKVIRATGCEELIRHSVSCSRILDITKLHTHCGKCSQCIDRRFAVLAAGLDAHDPEEMYKVDLLTGTRPMGEIRTMLEAYVRSATEISQMNEREFFGRHGEVTRLLDHIEGTPDENAKRTYDLLQRHAGDVTSVLDTALARHAREIREGSLPPSCLLLMALAKKYQYRRPSTKRGTSEAKLPPIERNTRKQATSLAKALRDIPPGRDAAGDYHDTMVQVVSVLFANELSIPKKEQKLSEGRKSGDIVCRNEARDGFFAHARDSFQIHCPFVFFECKNYSDDVGNQDFDQLAGRLSDIRGKLGVLTCRTIREPHKVLAHCKDRLQDRQGCIIVLTDADILALLRMRADGRIHEINKHMDDALTKVFL